MDIVKNLRYFAGGLIGTFLLIPVIVAVISAAICALFAAVSALLAILMAYAVVYVLPIPNNINYSYEAPELTIKQTIIEEVDDGRS